MFLEENDENPCSQIISLLTSINLNNEVGFCLKFGIAPKSNPYTPMYLTTICFLWNESYESVNKIH